MTRLISPPAHAISVLIFSAKSSLNVNEPSVSYSPSQTNEGETWPTQTASPTTPTISTGYGIPQPSLFRSTPTASNWGEIPHPSLTVTISFMNETSASVPWRWGWAHHKRFRNAAHKLLLGRENAYPTPRSSILCRRPAGSVPYRSR